MNGNNCNNHTRTFFEYYNELPTRTDQKALRHKIIINCKITKDAFYKWLNRGDVPDEKNRKIISEILDMPLEQLFPETEKVNQ